MCFVFSLFAAICAAFNRTIEELKWEDAPELLQILNSFNRTIEELKFVIPTHSPCSTSLLIAPLRN